MCGIWAATMLGAAVCALLAGRGEAAGTALMDSGRSALELTLTLCGAMTLWSGLTGILEATGDVARLGRLLRRLLGRLFPGVTDEATWADMSLNLAANVAGLGNAATPAGIRASQRLAAQGEAGRRALAMLLVLNNSSLQLAPTTVLSLRAACGSQLPGAIWPAALLSSLAATVTAAGLMSLVQRGGERHGGPGCSGAGASAGRALRR